MGTHEEQDAERVPWRLVGAVVSGTLLNLLNSSTVAVALVLVLGGLHHAYHLAA
jgi:hypothetical protein